MNEPLAAPFPARVLVVDDQEENRELLAEILADAGYSPELAAGGEEALAAVAERPPDAILLDVMMPRLDGFEVCLRLKRRRRTCFVPVVMVTALADVESKVKGLEAGADDFLNKPIHRPELLARLRSLLRIAALRQELDSSETIIFSMVALLEGKLPRLRDHSRRVAALAAATGERLALPPAERLGLVWGAALHDLGKVGVPESVLELSAAERSAAEEAAYRRHPELGEAILAPLGSLRGASPIVRHHHERLDGGGYPDGIGGSELALGVRVVAVANRWDGLRSAGVAAGEAARLLERAALAGELDGELVGEVAEAASSLPAELPDLVDLLPVPDPSGGGRILVVDDQPANRALYEELLAEAGYGVVAVDRGEHVRAAVEAERPDLILMDVRLPGEDGEVTCRALKSDPRYTFLPVILVTAYEGSEARLRGLRSGADEFLLAPVNRLELRARVRSLLRLRAYHQDLERHESVVLSLASAIEAKDSSTRGHSQRVGELARLLARELSLDRALQGHLLTAGLLHDIGKVAIPERLLNKPGRLSAEELEVLMTHPHLGFEICRSLRSAGPALDCIRHHHERWDGGGYPSGLAGAEIPIGARLLGVADAFDALTSERTYRRGLSAASALGVLRRETEEGKWDPRIFGALEALAARGELVLRDPPPETG